MQGGAATKTLDITNSPEAQTVWTEWLASAVMVDPFIVPFYGLHASTFIGTGQTEAHCLLLTYSGLLAASYVYHHSVIALHALRAEIQLSLVDFVVIVHPDSSSRWICYL